MSKSTDDDMQPEYDFSGGVRGRHHRAYQQGNNLVLLEPDIAEVFKDSAAVNHALRMLLDLARGEVKGEGKPGNRALSRMALVL